MNSQQQQANYNVQNAAGNSSDNATVGLDQRHKWTSGGHQTESTTTDAMKQPGQIGKGSK